MKRLSILFLHVLLGVFFFCNEVLAIPQVCTDAQHEEDLQLRIDMLGECLTGDEDEPLPLEFAAEVNRERGLIMMELGLFAESIVEFTDALALNEKDAYSLINRGVSYGKLGNFRQAIKDYKAALAFEESLADESLILLFKNYGDTLYFQRRYEEAVEQYNRALELDSSQDQVLNNRGTCFQEMERYKEAMVDYDSCLAINSENETCYINRARVHLKNEDFDASLQDYNRAVELDPGNEEILELIDNAERLREEAEKEDE